MADGLLDFQAFFDLINWARILMLAVTSLLALWMFLSIVNSMIRIGRLMQYSGMAAVVSSEYTVGFMLKRFFFGVLLLNFAATFLVLSEDITGQAYPLSLVSTETNSSGQVLLTRLVFDLFETYGWFNLIKAFWDGGKNNAPLYQQGKNPWGGIFVRIIGSLGLIFLPMIIDALWKYTSLNVLGLLVDMINKM